MMKFNSFPLSYGENLSRWLLNPQSSSNFRTNSTLGIILCHHHSSLNTGRQLKLKNIASQTNRNSILWNQRQLYPSSSLSTDRNNGLFIIQQQKDDLMIALKVASSLEDYHTIIKSWIEFHEPDQAQHVFNVLQQKYPDYIPSFDMITSFLDSWITFVDHQSIELSECIQSLKSQSQEEKEQDTSNTTWETLLKTLTSMIHSAENAELLLRKMEVWRTKQEKTTLLKNNTIPRRFDLTPSSHHYDVVIQAWAKIIRHGPTILESVLQGPDDFRRRSYRRTTIRSLLHGIPQRTTVLLENMERLALFDRVVGIQPTVDTYNIVLDIWTCSQEYHRRSMAQSIFQRMSTGIGSNYPWNHGMNGNIMSSNVVVVPLMPTRNTYQIMIQAWCRLYTSSPTQYISSSCAFHGTYYLLQMISLLEKGVDDFEPTPMDYKTVLQAWAKMEGSKKSAYRALSIMHIFESLYNKRQTQVRPDTECYKLTLESLAKMDPKNMQDVGERVDRLFIHMNDRNLLPDSGCFTAVIETWCRISQHNCCSSSTTKAF